MYVQVCDLTYIKLSCFVGTVVNAICHISVGDGSCPSTATFRCCRSDRFVCLSLCTEHIDML